MRRSADIREEEKTWKRQKFEDAPTVPIQAFVRGFCSETTPHSGQVGWECHARNFHESFDPRNSQAVLILKLYEHLPEQTFILEYGMISNGRLVVSLSNATEDTDT